MTEGRLRRVLLVEDDPGIQAVALIALEDVGGLEVEVCDSGPQALARAQGFAPDLLLLDVMMPGMTGPELLRALRERPGLEDVPAVFMTARVQKHEIDEYLTIGAAGVIPKPFEPMTLADDLRAIVQAAAEAREDQDFEAELQEVREGFRRELPGRVTELRRAWAEASEGGDLKPLVLGAHSMAGTGQTLGLTGLAGLAAELETLVRGTEGAVQHLGVRARVEALLSALEREAGA